MSYLLQRHICGKHVLGCSVGEFSGLVECRALNLGKTQALHAPEVDKLSEQYTVY